MSTTEKSAVAERCERFIDEVLKPRFSGKGRPTGPIDIVGRWRGDKFSFVARYRYLEPQDLGETFDEAFVRLDHAGLTVGEIRFNLMWRRHTGQWWPLYRSVALDEALHLVGSDLRLQPIL